MKPHEFKITLPDKDPYEGKATQKQKQKIWELGFRDQSVIDSLGKRQASILIDALLRDTNGQTAAPLIIFGLLFLIIGAVIFYFSHGEKAGPMSMFFSFCGLACGGLMLLAGVFRALSSIR